ncbi:MAG: metal-dependent transcriptional regulator [Deltaproteobacteria bacterium]|nr:metal-dependent transcriptional regulator [Candidatus Zymogenaceae bacterium]
MPTKQRLSPSMEDYLEVIYGLVEQNRVARVRDIADILSVTMPSVTGALKKLSGKELVNYDPHEVITLTPEGEVLARKLVHAHRSIASFLTEILNVRPDIAEKNACRMEHAIDDVVLTRLIRYIEFVGKCPGVVARFSEELGHFCPQTPDRGTRETCLEDRLRSHEEPAVKKKVKTRSRSAKP